VKKRSFILCLFVGALLFAACGYRNPNVYTGPHKAIYLAEWKNRTSDLSLDAKIYRSLTKWFQKSGSITTLRKKEGADLILAGEIVSIDLPSLSYSGQNVAAEVNVKLTVRYILKDIASNKILLEVPSELWRQEYLVSTSSALNQDREKAALDSIVDDLSQRIYQRTIAEIPKL
jgi:outer membrane lipopolysaccharide assembly protein LptE/RlpB